MWRGCPNTSQIHSQHFQENKLGTINLANIFLDSLNDKDFCKEEAKQ